MITKLKTLQPRVPWSWVTWMTLPWVSFFYAESLNHGPLTFTLRKFIEHPTLIAFLSSLNVAFNVLVGVATSYLSDRIWTRWGRRRPFLIVGWTGVALTLVFVPLAPNAWTLMGLIVLYQFFADIAKPLEPLHNEIVPPPQRGRAATIRNLAQGLMNIVFFGVLVAQFDRIYDLSVLGTAWRISGEALIYWTGSALLLAAVLFLIVGVKETRPPREVPREAFALLPALKEIFGRREWWLVYLLYAVPHLATSGIYTFEPLITTEQLNFSKATYGYVATIGIVVNLVIILPLAGWLADRMPRLRLMQYAVGGYAVACLGYFLLLRYVLDYRISTTALIAAGISISLFRTVINLVWGPLVYDYIPSDRFGTVSAGFAFIGGLVPFFLINLAGAWITGFTALFGTRGFATSDYSSVYLLQFVTCSIGLGITCFLSREIRLGRMRRYGLTPGAAA